MAQPSLRSRCTVAVIAVLACRVAGAQTSPGWGRFSLFASTNHRANADGTSSQFSELIATFTLRSAIPEGNGFEYAFDTRTQGSSGNERDTRTSLYEAYVGLHTGGGRMTLRLGQMWLNELGGLGSFGGVLGEYHTSRGASGWRLRTGVFVGLEPEILAVGYADNVKKGGVYAVVERTNGQRHVLGYVRLENSGLTERSVLTTLNFIPVGKTFFLYQAAEYDVASPGGEAESGLNYLFASARWAASRVFEVQASYHHGRSIDARSISNDVLNGRPVPARLLEGYLFESLGGRVTFMVAEGLRLYLGYGQDRNNEDDKAYPRTTIGVSANNLLKSGLDLTASNTSFDRASGGYDSLYVSLGRSLGSRVYLSLDYTSSLSVVRVVDGNGVVVESRPESDRYSLSSNINLSRRLAVFLTAERLEDGDGHDDRLLTGLSVRF